MINIITLLAIPAFAVGPSVGPAPAPEDSSSMTVVVVQNDRNVPVTVYVQSELGELKLGVVGPGADTTMRIADYLVTEGDIRFFVQPKGQLEEGSALVDVERGQRVGLVIPPR